MRQNDESTPEFGKSLEKLHSILKQTPAALLPAGVLALADFMAEQMRDPEYTGGSVGTFSGIEEDARMWLMDYSAMLKGYEHERKDVQARVREGFPEMVEIYGKFLTAVRDRIAAVEPEAAAIDEIERIRQHLGFTIAPAGPAVFYDLLSEAKTEEDIAAAIERFNLWALESYGENYISGYLAIDPEESTTEKLSTLQNALIEMYGVSRLDDILHDGRNLNELLIKLSDNPLPVKSTISKPSLNQIAYNHCANFDEQLRTLHAGASRAVKGFLEKLSGLTTRCAQTITPQQAEESSRIGKRMEIAISILDAK